MKPGFRHILSLILKTVAFCSLLSLPAVFAQRGMVTRSVSEDGPSQPSYFVGPSSLTLRVTMPVAQEGKKEEPKKEEPKKEEKIALKEGKSVAQSSLKTDDDKDKVQKQPCKVFTVDFKSGHNYKIDMVSKELDSYLRLEDPTGKELAKDDDSGGFVNARINFACRMDGAYRIVCTTFYGGTGPFSLTVQETPSAKIDRLDLKDGKARIDVALTKMDATDAALTHSVCKIYAIKLAKGKSYQIDMQSKDVDPYLRLEDSAGKELAKDDDGGGNHNARIQFECPENGEYRIIATTYFGGTGSFTLLVQEKKR